MKSLTLIRRLTTTNGNSMKKTLEDLGNTKVTELSQTRKLVKSLGGGLIARYQERFFYRNGGSFTPIVHIMILIGVIGYSFEYSHLKHLRDHPEEAH